MTFRLVAGGARKTERKVGELLKAGKLNGTRQISGGDRKSSSESPTLTPALSNLR
jgi:hypothetical protein